MYFGTMLICTLRPWRVCACTMMRLFIGAFCLYIAPLCVCALHHCAFVYTGPLEPPMVYPHFCPASVLYYLSPSSHYCYCRLISGTQRVISFLRQMVEHNGFYRSVDQAWVKLERIQFVGACNPPTDPGRKPLTHRYITFCGIAIHSGIFCTVHTLARGTPCNFSCCLYYFVMLEKTYNKYYWKKYWVNKNFHFT